MDARLYNGECTAGAGFIEPPLNQKWLSGYVGVIDAIVFWIAGRRSLPVESWDSDAMGGGEKQTWTDFRGGALVPNSDCGPEIVRGGWLPANQRLSDRCYGILLNSRLVNAPDEQSDRRNQGDA
jgi:hypothetical protein